MKKTILLAFFIFFIGFVSATFIATYNALVYPEKMIQVEIENKSTSLVREIIVQAYMGSNDSYYIYVSYFNLDIGQRVMIPVTFERDGMVQIYYAFDDNTTKFSQHGYIMVGDKISETVTNRGVIQNAN